jgi:hypothetical protein
MSLARRIAPGKALQQCMGGLVRYLPRTARESLAYAAYAAAVAQRAI